MDQTARNEIAIAFGAIAVEAGRAIMAVRGSEAGLRHKSDGSPVTKADIDADRIICARLASLLPDIPVVTEEVSETHAFSVPAALSWSIRSMAPGSLPPAAMNSPSTSR